METEIRPSQSSSENIDRIRSNLRKTVDEIWEMSNDIAHITATDDARVGHKSSCLALSSQIVEWAVVCKQLMQEEDELRMRAEMDKQPSASERK